MTLRSRAIIYIITMSFIANPVLALPIEPIVQGSKKAAAAGWRRFLSWGKKAAPTVEKNILSQGTDIAAHMAAQIKGKATSQMTMRQAEMYIDDLAKITGSAIVDFSQKVIHNIYPKTVGRTKELKTLIVKIANPMISGVALIGDKVGKTQLIVALKEAILAGTVPPELANAHIIQIPKTATLDSIERNLEKTADYVVKTAADEGREKPKIVILHFEEISRFLPEQLSAKFDEIVGTAKKEFNERGINLKVIIEVNEPQIDKLSKVTAIVRSFTRLEIQNLSTHEIESVVQQFANRLSQEEGYSTTPEAFRKLMQISKEYSLSIEETKGLLYNSILLKQSLLNSTENIVAENLNTEKEALVSILDQALAIIAKLQKEGREGGEFAAKIVKTYPDKIKNIDEKIAATTANYRQFEAWRKEFNDLGQALLEAQTKGGQIDPTIEARHKELLKAISQVTPEDIALQVHMEKGVDLNKLLGQQQQLTLSEKLVEYKKMIFGQDHIVDSVWKLCQRIHAKFKGKGPPVVIFLGGGSRTGKTEMGLAIAMIEYGSADNMIIINMGDYSAKHAAEAAISAPKGYAGYDDPGLVEQIKKLVSRGGGVVVLDEFEKADPAIQKLLLSPFDVGVLKDSKGESVELTNITFVITSNLGQELPGSTTSNQFKTYLGKVGQESVTFDESGKLLISDGSEQPLYKVYKQEFLNRIHEFYVTNKLERPVWDFIFDKKIEALNKDMLKEIYRVEVSEAAKKNILDSVNTPGAASALPANNAAKKIWDEVNNILNYGVYTNLEGKPFELKGVSPGDLLEAFWSEESGLGFRIMKRATTP